MEQKRILIVDDEESICEILLDFLADTGHIIDVASDGFEALTKLAQNYYHLVLTDIKMPNLDGVELLQAIQARSIEVPIKYVMTGSLEHSRDFLAELGVSAIFEKPLQFELVKNKIKKGLQ